MSKRTLTNPDATPDWTLSQQQLTAIDLLVTGKTLQAVADAIGVQRPTVSQWVNHHPGFQAELNLRRQQLWADLVDGLRALAPKAMEVLKAELEGETPLQAAIHVLKACGLYGGIAAPRGPIEPDEIAIAMQLKDYDRAHAAENAQIAMQRKGFDRMLSALAVDPLASGWTPPS